jgi:hypothetical protein
MNAAVRQTGGTVRRVDERRNDLADVISDFRTSYVLRFTPQAPRPGWHELKITVRREGRFDVRARKGYEITH